MERREAPGVGETPHDEPLREVRPRAVTKRVANPSREARAFCNGEVCEAFRPNAAPPGAPPGRRPNAGGGWCSTPPRHERDGSENGNRIIFRKRESQDLACHPTARSNAKPDTSDPTTASGLVLSSVIPAKAGIQIDACNTTASANMRGALGPRRSLSSGRQSRTRWRGRAVESA
jgi:hypothetical protein